MCNFSCKFARQLRWIVHYVNVKPRSPWNMIFPADLHCFPFIWSLFLYNIIFRVLSVGLREAAEFQDYSLVALSVLVCTNTRHQNTSVKTVCCFEWTFCLLIIIIFLLSSLFETILNCSVSWKENELHLSSIQTHTIHRFP
jgi:hypothetical protein